ncbi:MAG: HAMP domain-containing sensor histidine kinase [Actinomycetota bacterium]
MVTLGLLVSWGATYLFGGAGHVPPHWFYVPILIAAARFGMPGTLVTAVTAGVLAGPLVPLDVETWTAQPLSDWTGRTGFFVGNGLIMSVVIGQLRSMLSRELDIAKAEQELARHKEAVIQTVSHEFRTPLTVIRGSVEIFAESAVSEEVRPLLENLERATRRLDDLVRVVLAASETLIQPEQTREEPVGLQELCGKVAALAEPGAETRTRFSVAADAQVVVADPDLLALLLRVVIDNAMKFSPPGSPVDIEAQGIAHAVEIRVGDRGPGMTEEQWRRAFEPFTQQDESMTRTKQGIGLGLFAARKTIELMGGNLELRARALGGTEVILTIPQRSVGGAGGAAA